MKIFTTHDGLVLKYRDEGQGMAVLCLPGLTRNHDDFNELYAALTAPVRLIALTSRGRYPSDFDPNFENYTVAQEAADAIALLDHLKIDQAVFVGTSRGGLIALHLAHTHPDRIAGTVLNDIAPDIEADGLARIFDYIGVQPAFTTVETAIAALKTNMGAQFPNLTDEKWRELAERWYHASPDGVALKYDHRLRDALIAQFQTASENETPPPDLWRNFDMLAAKPLGIIHGENSDLLSADTVAKAKTRQPDILTATIADRGHVPFLDEPQALRLIETLLKNARI